MGPLSIFRPKVDYRVQGGLTQVGATCFEKTRRILARIKRRHRTAVSDADTIDFLARCYIRGEKAVIEALKLK